MAKTRYTGTYGGRGRLPEGTRFGFDYDDAVEFTAVYGMEEDHV